MGGKKEIYRDVRFFHGSLQCYHFRYFIPFTYLRFQVSAFTRVLFIASTQAHIRRY